MKTLLIAFSLMMTLVACNKSAETKHEEQRMEATEEYRDDMKDVNEERMEAVEDRNEKLDEANKDLIEDKEDERD